MPTWSPTVSGWQGCDVGAGPRNLLASRWSYTYGRSSGPGPPPSVDVDSELLADEELVVSKIL